MIRQFFVWLHRWVGLAMAAFLIIEGVTGSLLAFRDDLIPLLNPRLVATPPSPDAKPLDLASLAARAEAMVPHAQVRSLGRSRDDQAWLRLHGQIDPATGEEYDIGLKLLFLDPYTGNELARLTGSHSTSYTQGFLPNVMPFVYDLHASLALGETGDWILAIVAIAWTIDCFTGFYLTLPVAIEKFLRRWKPAWLIKRRGGFFRLNFDLHRASGLWLWPMLFVFAWSSVFLADDMGVYSGVTGALFDYRTDEEEQMPQHKVDEPPKLDWRAAQTAGEKLMAEQASIQHFKIEKPVQLGYTPSYGLYHYGVLTNRTFPDDKEVEISFDGDTGAFYRDESGISAAHTGNTVTNWLFALHVITGPVNYLAYQIFVFLIGLVIALLSVTGVYIWWKKRKARQFSMAHRGVAAEEIAAE